MGNYDDHTGQYDAELTVDRCRPYGIQRVPDDKLPVEDELTELQAEVRGMFDSALAEVRRWEPGEFPKAP
jgi:hypothetical protein